MEKNNNCLFCDRYGDKLDLIQENDFCYAVWDGFPVSAGHSLIIPKKHILSFFDLEKVELESIFEMMKDVKDLISEKYHPDSYNIGINDGEEAGRTIHHLHIHIIPRYKGDVENPRGGVRHIIPGKGDYKSS